VLGDTPQDLSFKGVRSFVEIGEECVIREGVTIHRGTKEGTTTSIGARCYLMANAHVGHNGRLGERVIIANGSLLAGYVVVEDAAFISGNCCVHQFCRVGRLAMLGGGAIISKDCPPYCTLRSNALNRVVGLNVIGLRRAGLDAAARQQIKEAFQLLYLSGLTTTDALKALQEKFPAGPAAEFGRFIAGSTRGICGGPRTRSADDDE
jgi:UDP-N-acetylglucosamine acyltransferase